MATKKHRKRIFSHARLLTIETILLVGLLQTWFEDWLVAHASLPGWLKISILMIIMIGVLGFLLVYIERIAKSSLSKAHDVVNAVPFPWTMLLVHIAVFAILFVLYGVTFEIKWLR